MPCAAHWALVTPPAVVGGGVGGSIFFKMLYLVWNAESKRNDDIGKWIQKKIVRNRQNNLVCKGPLKVSASTTLKASPRAAHWPTPDQLCSVEGWRFDSPSWRKTLSLYLIGISWILVCVSCSLTFPCAHAWRVWLCHLAVLPSGTWRRQYDLLLVLHSSGKINLILSTYCTTFSKAKRRVYFFIDL